MFTSTTTATPKYIKSKAYGLIGTIALFTSLAFLMGPGVSADEVTPATTTPTVEAVAPAIETPETPAVETPTVTSEAVTSEAVTSEAATSEAVTSETVTSEAVTSTASSEAVTSTASSETASSEATSSEATSSETTTSETTDPSITTATTTPAYPTKTPQPVYTKTGTTITVQNPDIHIDFAKGHGIYATNTFVFHAQFEDNFAINDGDQFVLTLPKEMTFPTSTNFAVINEAGETIGQAATDVTTNAVTVTFNDYLQKHPENKFLNLAFDQKWTAYVKDNTTFTTSVKGTLLKIAIAKEIAQQDGTRKFAKWGIQSKEDPSIIDWTLQLNYGNLWSNQVLTNFQLLDTLGPDQVLLEDSIRAEHITNVTPYVSKGDVMNELLDLKTNPKGFSFKIANLNKMIYVWYKSKLTKPVTESYDPTNRADYIYDSPTEPITPYNATATLSGGRGDGGGKNRPIVETPLVPSETPSQSLSTSESPKSETSSETAKSEGNSTSSSEAFSEGNSTSSSEAPKSETTSETMKSESNSETPKSETTSEGNSTSSSEAPKSETTSETTKSEGNSTSSSEAPKSETTSETVKSEGNSTSSSEAPKSETTSETMKSEGNSTSSSEAPKSETTSETVKSEGNSTSSSEAPKSETTSETAKSEGNSTSSSEAPKSETTSETVKSEGNSTSSSEAPNSETTSETAKSEGNSTSSSEAPKSETTSETIKSEAPKSETTSETMKSEGNSTSSSEVPKSETHSETVKSETTKSETASEMAKTTTAKELPKTGETTSVILNYIGSLLALGASLTTFFLVSKKKSK